MPDFKSEVLRMTKPLWWWRRRKYLLLMVIGLGTVRWALGQLGWLFGWSSELVKGHSGRVFDAIVILAAGALVFLHAIRHILRPDKERRRTLDRFHDRAVRASEGTNPMSDSKISIPHAKVLSLVANPRSRRFLVRIIIVCGVFHFGFMLFVLGCLALGAVEPRVGIRTALPFLFLGLLSLRAYALVREKGMVEA